ncbi:pyridoxamine 5'-phosphate oxidase family protein [Crystallibacter degradans]|uniref:pyridoxamine 5'-phosphate oxidase family protein n=1 Tax=Crystallibacter degradans TaxID=2726743 RepID=UPI001473D16D|nr:pyridoxamine 5'-phosphate oxidase family protein [Arthrobacter sp. SF27]NMR29307.1 pyridoxamine 5'-phosphate oxidase family protein [Arthrobacter sp. SF27]
MTNQENGHQEVAKILKDADIAVLTTVNADNQLVSRPLALQSVEFDGLLWFFTQDPSPKADEIRANRQVNVSVHAGGGYLSISGTADIVHNRPKIDDLWSPAVEPWFENGKDDPTVALIRVAADTAEYWASDSPKVATLFKLAKGMVTGEQPDVGKNDVVEM